MELSFCWWNIGISPPIQRHKEKNQHAISLAKKYIKDFSINKNLDVISICEVSQEERIDFSCLADELEMEYLDLSEKVGRVILDYGIMYETSKLSYIAHKPIVHTDPTNKSLRVGTRVVFEETQNRKIITLFLSHWPSKLHMEETIRSNIADKLRLRIDNILDRYGIDSQFICMGDYNTEPYSDAITNKLYTTRDYHIIKNKRRLLFNPSWFLFSDKKTNNLGTYLHKQANQQRWYVLDQVIFSSSFIYGGSDCLKVQLDTLDSHKILDDENRCLDSEFKENFDHYPLFFKVHHEQ